MCLEIKIVEPAIQPSETMWGRIAIFGVVALRRCQRPVVQVWRFGKSCRKRGARFLRWPIDLKHQDKLITGPTHRSIENAVTPVLNDRPRLPICEIARRKHIDGAPAV